MAAVTFSLAVDAWCWVTGVARAAGAAGAARARSRRSAAAASGPRRGGLATACRIQCSSRVRCSSRAGRAPEATRTLRRCRRVLLSGSSSRAAWVSGRCPVASPVSRARTLSRRIHPRAIAGRPTSARACLSGSRPARTRPVPGSASRWSTWSWRWQRRHARGQEPPGIAAARAGLPEAGTGCRAVGAERLVAGSCLDRGEVPAAASSEAQERAQAPHQGWPVTLEIMPGAVRPQTAQVSTWRGLQLPQTGPSGVRTATRCRRPQRTQSSRLSGSLIRQYGHSGCPSGVREAGSQTRPQRPHGTARERAVQARQARCPFTSLLKVTTRPQSGQAGRLIRVAPASQSASISRRIIGKAALAPSPVSSPGSSSRAQASFCRCAALVTTCPSTALTVPVSRPGSAAVMTATSRSRGSRGS